MKLDKATQELIRDAVFTAESVKINNIVIDEDGIRGIDDNQLVVILKNSFTTVVPFEALAIGGVEQFVQRYRIHENNEATTIEADIADNGDVKIITLKSKNLKLEFRCMKPARVKAPKKTNDTTYASFEISDDTVDMIKRGLVTMKSDYIQFIKMADNDNVNFKIIDVNNSSMDFEITDSSLEQETAGDCVFACSYPIKTLLAALKDADENRVNVGVNNTLTVIKNGINVIIPAGV